MPPTSNAVIAVFGRADEERITSTEDQLTDADAVAHAQFGTDAATIRAALATHFAAQRKEHATAIERAARELIDYSGDRAVAQLVERIALRVDALRFAVESEQRARGS